MITSGSLSSISKSVATKALKHSTFTEKDDSLLFDKRKFSLPDKWESSVVSVPNHVETIYSPPPPISEN